MMAVLFMAQGRHDRRQWKTLMGQRHCFGVVSPLGINRFNVDYRAGHHSGVLVGEAGRNARMELGETLKGVRG